MKFKQLIFVLSMISTVLPSAKIKRQLYRENLLPQYGGKIPDSALQPERIVLNRLNQNGLYTVNGVYLQQVNPHVNNQPKRSITKTIKINKDESIETTYLLNDPIESCINFPKFKYYFVPLLPETSLKLIQQNRDNYKKYKHSHDIFTEYKPLLQKLHEKNYI